MTDSHNGPPGFPPARDSATTILVRDADHGIETFLMRRRKGRSFSGASVFPGGAVDEADQDPVLADHARPPLPWPSREYIREPGLSEDRARAVLVCALRELFEEAGVLLAGEASRALADRYRRDIHQGRVTLAEMAEQEGLFFDLGRLIPYSRWIAPLIEQKRFDARFFLVPMPKDAEAGHDEVELVDSFWIAPAEALRLQRSGEIRLFPPTLVTLSELAECGSVEDALAVPRGRDFVVNHPEAFKFDGGFGVLLPNDPEYKNPDYKRAARPGEITRVLFRDGTWTCSSLG